MKKKLHDLPILARVNIQNYLPLSDAKALANICRDAKEWFDPEAAAMVIAGSPTAGVPHLDQLRRTGPASRTPADSLDMSLGSFSLGDSFALSPVAPTVRDDSGLADGSSSEDSAEVRKAPTMLDFLRPQ